MQRFTELQVWQRSHALALDVYRVTAVFPTEERFGLTSQMRRAMVSVGANIAEGSKRKHGADYARFLNMAEGSLAEVECLVLLGRDLNYLNPNDAEKLSAELFEVGSMLSALRGRVEREHRE
jgi:four helix bundle protein